MEDENTILDPVDPVSPDVNASGDPAPAAEPEPVTVEEEQDPAADPETDPVPIQVISVDELIDRLQAPTEEPAEEEMEEPPAADPEEPAPSNDLTLPAEYYDFSMNNDTNMLNTVQDILEEIREEREVQAPHPLLTTNFADYTVTEGLLLIGLLFGVGKVCVRMLKGGFKWLLW